MAEAYIVEALRTAGGRRGGALKDWHPADLGGEVPLSDVRYALRYMTPFWFLMTPVVYPMSTLSSKYFWLVALNPMAPLVEAFRWGTLGRGDVAQGPLTLSLSLVLLTMLTGLWFFNREETASVDKL